MTSPLRKEREIESEENLQNETADTLNPPAGEEVEIQREKPKLVRSETAAAQHLEPASATRQQGTENSGGEPLFPGNELSELQNRWDKIQTSFVDQPRNAVKDAEQLVSSAMQRLSEVFSDERSKLERQWNSGSNVSTEELRVAFQRYRSFFQRVLSV